GEPAVWHALMETLTEVIINYLRGQIEAGADAVQLFDSWLGLLDPETYESAVLPYTGRVFAALRGLAPTIHFSTGTSSLVELVSSAGSDVVSVDWRLPLDEAWERLGPRQGIQGNLDPTLLLAPWDAIARGARNVLARASNRPGHIFNLGHGILPATMPEPLERLTEFVHTESLRR
ncbi:MAG: uroporphyrinogen decarboxylase, partial [Chloroflexota bacterium]|nr:uroporphyrinogen decarboxylase [Chloroflexota bacterium]